MSLEHWFAFILASTVLVIIPGPTVLLIISYAMSHGRKAASATVAGVALGDCTAMVASMLGLGALLSASSAVFIVLKWMGAVYLVYLGLKLWRAPVSGNMDDADAGQPVGESFSRIFAHTWLVTALNPKGIVFFVAFLPQFLDLSRPTALQMLIYGLTFLVIASTNAVLYGIAATRARDTIRKPRVQKIVNRTGGTLMIGAGIASVTLNKA